MEKYKILGQEITFSTPRLNYILLDLKYQELTNEYVNKFYKIYDSFHKLSKMVKELEDKVIDDILAPLTDDAMEYIRLQEIYTESESSIIKKFYSLFSESFGEKFGRLIEDEYEDIRYEMREAGTISAGWNAGSKEYALLKDKEVRDILANSIKTFIANVQGEIIRIVEANTKIKFEESDYGEEKQAKAIAENILDGKVAESKIPICIAQVLLVYPSSRQIYEYIIRNYGDADKEVDRISYRFGCNMVPYKKELVELFCSKAVKSLTYDEEQVLSVKQEISDFCRALGYGNTSFHLQPFDQRLREIDIQLRTVEGVEYKTREIASDVRDDFILFNNKAKTYTYERLDLLDVDVRKKIESEILDLPYKYAGFHSIATARLGKIMQPYIDRQTMKKNMTSPQNFCGVLYNYVHSSALYQNMSKHIYTMEFAKSKSNKAPLPNTYGVPLIYHDFSSLGAFKKGFILTTRGCVIYNAKNNIQFAPFNYITSINIKDGYICINQPSENIVFKRPSTLPSNQLNEYTGLIQYLLDIFKLFSEAEISEIENHLSGGNSIVSNEPVPTSNTITNTETTQKAVQIKEAQPATAELPKETEVDPEEEQKRKEREEQERLRREEEQKRKEREEQERLRREEEQKRKEQMRIQKEEEKRRNWEALPITNKSKSIALVLSILFGWLGIDRFYLGQIFTGIIKLLTGGLLGIWWFADIILIATGVLRPKDGRYKN